MVAKSKNYVEFEKQAALAATGSDKPYAAMIKYAGLAAIDGDFSKDDNEKFKKALRKARPSETHKTMLDNRASEAWSCVKLAFEYKYCAKDIFANIEKATPTPTGIYDIACSIRNKAQFSEKGAYWKKGIGLDADSGKAPSVEAMQAAIKYSNAYRNNLSGAGVRPLDQVIASMAKTLESFRDGKRDPKTGKGAKDKNDKAVTLPVMTSKTLGRCIAALNEYKAELVPAAKNGNGKAKSNVVPMRKRAAA